MKRRLRIYLAGPISRGDLCVNINNATDCFHRLMKAGLSPFCPAWSAFANGCWPTNDGNVLAEAHRLPRGTTHEDWLAVDLEWVRVANAVLRLPGESAGADAEVAAAKEAGIPVFDSESRLLAWAESVWEMEEALK